MALRATRWSGKQWRAAAGAGATAPARLLAAGLCLLLLVAAVLGLAATSRQKVYFYNPESNINNFSSLKSEFDGYLASEGDFEFQPFSSRQTFEQFLGKEEGAIFLLSSWHFQQLRAQHPMRPLFVGSVDGKPTQKRVLYAGKAVANLAALRGQTIASAGSREFTQNMLAGMLEQQKAASVGDTVRIIPVPKDIDALMAVAMGLASAAITTERSLEQLKSANPRQHDALHRLGESEEMLRVIVAVKEGGGDPSAGLVRAIERMASAPKGEYALQMIGLNGWQRYDARMTRQAKP